MQKRRWPDLWQEEARDALDPYVDSEWQVDLWVDPPSALSGTRYAGLVYSGPDGLLEIIHDRSGRADVNPWKLPRGPVLRVKVRPGPREHWKVVYAHPDWNPISGLP